MANVTLTQPAQLLKEHIKKKRWQRGVAVLSLAAFIATGSVLIRPAATEEQPVYCGYTEHTHSEECYGEAPLVCTVEENHVHDGNCYQLVDTYVCGLEESEGHSHTEECYQEQSVLTCGLEETAGHTHTEQCYALQPVCTCGLDGIEGHVHDESCYTEQPVLVCGLEECAPHTHTEECYTIQPVLVCGLEESEGHTHTEECLGQTLQLTCEIPEGHVHSEECYGQPELVCTLEEHQHTDLCYSNPGADLETAEVWESTLDNLELTDNWRENIIKVAKSQLGYSESAANFTVENSERKGYTRYGAWYGIPYGDWCAMFVSFCIRYAGITEEAFPINAGCYTWVNELSKLDMYRRADSGYQPQSGDIIFFDNDSDGLSDHVGLVSEIRESAETEAAKLITLEGNNGLAVAEFEYDLSSDKLLGYGIMPDNPEEKPEDESDEPAEENSEEDGNAEVASDAGGELRFRGGDYTVIVSYTAEAQLPADTELSVREILPGTEEYDEYILATQQATGESSTLTFARIFDVTLLSGGVEIEPAVPVDMQILYDSAISVTGDDTLNVVHITDEGTELIPADGLEDEQGINGFSYSQNGFSVIVTVASHDSGFMGSAPTTQDVQVSLTWDDAKDHSSASVTIELYSDGTATGKTLTLSASNSWKGSFTGLTYGPSYTVKATSTATGYNFDITYAEARYYKATSASSLETGKYYILRYNTDSAVQISGGALAAGSVSIAADGTFDAGQKNMIWYFDGSCLRNVATKQYITLNTAEGQTGWTLDKLSGATVSLSDGKLSGTSGETTRYLVNSTEGTESTDSATVYSLYSVSEGAATIASVQGTESIIVSSGTASKFEHSKTIDWLGDSTNSGTDATGSDLYRLNLMVNGGSDSGVDLLLVLDTSNSMKSNGGRNSLHTFLNGTTTTDGFIETFTASSKNKLAIITFSGPNSSGVDSELIGGWNTDWSTYGDVDLTGYTHSGTNYSAGLYKADKMFEERASSKNQKVMFFLSDGAPSYAYIPGSNTDDPASGAKRTPSSPTENESSVITYTNRAITYFHTNNPTVEVYSVVFGSNANINYTVLDNLDDQTSNNSYKTTNSASDLSSVMDDILAPKNMTITDKLSKYVTYYSADPDLTVTKVLTSSVGTNAQAANTTYLYQNGKLTSSATNELDRVTYTATADDPNSTGYVKAEFNENFYLSSDYTYYVSFNVQTTDSAFNEYSNNSGYLGIEGDEDTDATSNVTSSEQPGFYSNESATAEYYVNNVPYREYFEHPVVQINLPDKAEDDGFAIIEKRFIGLNSADVIPSNFTITLTDGTDTYTLKKNDANWADVSDGTDIVWQWTIEGMPAGTYTVTEEGFTVDRQNLTTKLLNSDSEISTAATATKITGTVQITPSATSITAVEETSGTYNRSIQSTDDNTVVFAGLMKGTYGAAIFSEKELSASVRAKIEQTLTAKNTKWTDFVYYVFDPADGDCTMDVYDSVVAYTASDHVLALGQPSWWQSAYVLSFGDFNPDIVIKNTYEPAAVDLEVKNETPEDTDKEFTYTVSYVLDGVTTNLTGFTLKDGETYTVQDIPIGATVTVTEGDHGGYYVFTYEGTNSASKQPGDSISVTLNADGSVTFYNNPGTVLPETGGIGSESFMLAGLLLVEVSIILLRRRRKARS